MSHAANLRKQQQQQRSVSQLESPAKRRKISTGTRPHNSNGVSTLVNGDGSSKISAATTNNAKKNELHKLDESHAKVTSGQEEADDISSSSDEESTSDEEDEDDDGESEMSSDSDNSDALDNIEVVDVQELSTAKPTQEPSHQEEPSFGELIRRDNPGEIDVTSGDDTRDTIASHPTIRKAISAPNATTLTTVLVQALRTNDTDLLETCLATSSLDSIRATIERLHSSLAANLLSKLAARLHRRPGRAGSLMVWVQWTVVAHGGYLASQPAAMKQIRKLYQVVQARAAGLQPLLVLKGKLDMLEAQMQLRRSLQAQARQDEDCEGVIYVEGAEQASAWPNGTVAIGQDGDADDLDVPGDEVKLLDADSDLDFQASSGDEEEEDEGISDEEAEETDDDSDDSLSDGFEVDVEDDASDE